jgi:hypothetical protein
MVLIKGPVEAPLGYALVPVRIPRSFSIASKEVTVGQYQPFLKDNPSIRTRIIE